MIGISSWRSFIYLLIYLLFRYLQTVGHHAGGRVLKSVSLCFQPGLMWPFYPLLRSKYSTSSSVFFRRVSSIYTCTFAVSMGKCEFRTFLCQYLELPPQLRYFFLNVTVVFLILLLTVKCIFTDISVICIQS